MAAEAEAGGGAALEVDLEEASVAGLGGAAAAGGGDPGLGGAEEAGEVDPGRGGLGAGRAGGDRRPLDMDTTKDPDPDTTEDRLRLDMAAAAADTTMVTREWRSRPLSCRT